MFCAYPDFVSIEKFNNIFCMCTIAQLYQDMGGKVIIQGKPKITINKNKFFKKENETVFIPTGAIHRIENYYKKPVKIIEVQTGSILKESDIIRFSDMYGRIK